MTIPPPAPSWHPPFRRHTVRYLIIAAGCTVLLCCGLVGLLAILPGSHGATTPAPPVAASPTRPSDAQIRAWFAERGLAGGPEYALIRGFSWSGDTLVIDTAIVADSDAKAPAIALCGAGSSYLIGTSRGVDVRVNDRAGDVLVTRHEAGEECSWRR